MTIENTAKDIEPHHIRAPWRNRQSNIVDRLEKDLQLIPEVDKIPQSVHDVCGVITTQFTDTATRLRNQASNLRLRANQLDIMAKRIEGAAESVPTSLKEWVQLETTYRDAALRLSNVEPDPGFE